MPSSDFVGEAGNNFENEVGLLSWALRDDDSCLNPSKPDARMVLFRSQLRIQIPPLSPSPVGSPKSPPEFGIKTRNSKIGSISSSLARKSGFGSANSGMDVVNSPRVFTGSLSATEMSSRRTTLASYLMDQSLKQPIFLTIALWGAVMALWFRLSDENQQVSGQSILFSIGELFEFLLRLQE